MRCSQQLHMCSHTNASSVDSPVCSHLNPAQNAGPVPLNRAFHLWPQNVRNPLNLVRSPIQSFSSFAWLLALSFI